MAGNTDFLILYQELGLTPGACSVAELKQAYRRRVVQLHPDRHPDGWATAADSERFQRLTVLYGAAIAFQRRYDRLPGTEAPLRQATEPRIPGVPSATSFPKRSNSRRLWLVLLILAALTLAFWGLGNTQGQLSPSGPVAAPLPASAQANRMVAPFDFVQPDAKIRLGTDAAWVHRVEGAPINAEIDHWDYGPSWVEFRKGKVSDWYSSPLRPLKVASPRPLPTARKEGEAAPSE